jgi:hypothetical protein
MTATRLIVPPRLVHPGTGRAPLAQMDRSKLHAWNLLDTGAGRSFALKAGVN